MTSGSTEHYSIASRKSIFAFVPRVYSLYVLYVNSNSHSFDEFLATAVQLDDQLYIGRN